MNIDALIGKLTLEEKAALLQGWTVWSSRQIKHLHIPAMFMSDGPVGLRKQAGDADHLGIHASVPATCFPTAATMANSWDVSLGRQLGEALGREAAANDVHVVLGPGLNIKRSPLCGRNFEYFSEDPYLSGKMAASYIQGIQENGVAACAKHYAVNSQELRRMSMDAVLDERTLREIYLTGFEIAVKEGHAQAVMSSYNRVNGVYANENKHLLEDILRQEWGCDGYVVTDWGADNDHTEGVRAGCNLVMPAPGPGCAIGLVEAVKAGKLEEAVLDQRIAQLLKVVFETHEAVEKAPKTFDADAHHAIARKCAEGSIVLLDNDGILPLEKGACVAIIGEFAKAPRYQGAGSSQVNPTKLENLYDGLADDLNITGYARGYDRKDPNPRQELIDEAVSVARSAETVLLCVGLDEILESEGMDRPHMELSQSQLELIKAVCEANRNVILVLSGGAPFVMPERSLYRAAIHGYLGGQAGSLAMADAIVGKINPSGKLSETWPHSLLDTPSYPYFPSAEHTAEYREGLYVGYRYYDTVGKAVRYPFGYGLSYTTFAYSDLEVSADCVCFTLTNTGSTDGAEVAQVYISCLDGKLFRPRKELKGFAKVFLKAGQSKRVTVSLDDKAFRHYNVATNRWSVETADYQISVAANVSDVRLQATVHVMGDLVPDPYAALPSYRSGHIEAVSDEEFQKLLGRPIPDGRWHGELDRNDAFCQLYYAKSIAGRWLYKLLTHMKERAEAKGTPELNILFVYNMPLRGITKMVGTWVSDAMVDDMVFMFNGHFWRGLGRLIRDFFRNRTANRRFCAALEECESK